MKEVPTTWEDTRFVAGYPGKYTVLARKHGGRWFVAGVNAKAKTLELELDLPMLAGKEISHFSDDPGLNPVLEKQVIPESGKVQVTMRPNGGVILRQE
jgi:hypothetical protein